jgi:hypothetical protein
LEELRQKVYEEEIRTSEVQLKLQHLQESMRLNDNRAVYRSRLLLDSDLAARSASLARIYNDLGFQQRALVEGWKSPRYPSDEVCAAQIKLVKGAAKSYLYFIAEKGLQWLVDHPEYFG